jgi:hypothetical protein
MSWRGFEKRVKSPIPVTGATVLISAIAGITFQASTTGRVDGDEYLFRDSL